MSLCYVYMVLGNHPISLQTATLTQISDFPLRVVGGFETLTAMENVESDPKTDKPKVPSLLPPSSLKLIRL